VPLNLPTQKAKNTHENSSLVAKSQSQSNILRNFPSTLTLSTLNVNFNTDDDISDEIFKTELFRLRGAIYFSYGILQLAFSYFPPQLKIINYIGYSGDRNEAIKLLKYSKNSVDFRSLLAVIALLWYYLIIVPFFAIENADLSEEINLSTQILNEYEQFDTSALFLFFSGRRQRLKKKIKYAILHYDAALRAKNIPRELKILVMNELALVLLIKLNFHDAMHYFNELR
jgi:hypothetical protein